MPFPLRLARLPSAAGIATLLGLLSAAAEPAPPLLARIDVPESLSSFPLPVYAQLRDTAGQDYVLVQADPADLKSSGWSFQPLDAPAAAADYVLAREFRKGARAAAAQGPFRIVHDDGRHLVIRSASPGDDIEALGLLGFQCRRLPTSPMDLERCARAPSSIIAGDHGASHTSSTRMFTSGGSRGSSTASMLSRIMSESGQAGVVIVSSM